MPSLYEFLQELLSDARFRRDMEKRHKRYPETLFYDGEVRALNRVLTHYLALKKESGNLQVDT